jgi:hypothetical protein
MLKRLLLISSLLAACAGKPSAPVPNPPQDPSAKQERSWKDKLGITYVANSLACTYKLLAFFTDSAAARPISRTSGTDTLFSCVGDKKAIH